MYGLDPLQLKHKLIKPTLELLELYTPAACNLVLGTAMQESRLTYMYQLGGPAIGLFQMEPATFYDIKANFLEYQPKLEKLVERLSFGVATDPNEMAGNLFFAIAMCRVHYRRVAQPLPLQFDAEGMARYWKMHYNTPQGRGTVVEAIRHFQEACNV